MKHTSDCARSVLEGASAIGVRIEERDAALMCGYLMCVLRHGERVNVTAIDDPAEAARLHLTDSLAALPAVDSAPSGVLVDVGSGGGFPGVPLCIAGVRPAVLIESVGKKADVVARCCEEALPGYPVSVVPLRTEVYARDHCRAASVAVSRAVGELPAVLELSAPLVRVGGICVAMKGDLTREELSRGDRAAEMLGMERKSLQRLVLPVGGEARSIVQYAVVEDASLVLPRREGLATKRPLG